MWGAGEIYNTHLNGIHYFELTGQINVVGVLSESIIDKWSTLDDYPILNKNQICWKNIDLIIIMSERYLREILNEIEHISVVKINVISFRVLEIPGVKIEKYIKLVDEKVSIISNNCWGGLVCRTLGIECRSPFKNLFLKDADYLRVISDLKKYMRCEPEFVRFDIDTDNKKYPVLRILDAEIHCNHTENIETAIFEWNKRRKKINLDNIFFEMCTEDRIIADKFIAITKDKKKICFLPKENKEDKSKKDIFYVDLQTEKRKLWEQVNEYASLRGTKFDLVDMLLENKIIERRKRIEDK